MAHCSKLFESVDDNKTLLRKNWTVASIGSKSAYFEGDHCWLFPDEFRIVREIKGLAIVRFGTPFAQP